LHEGRRVVGFREKPVLSFHCSMGIYAFDPALLDLIPQTGMFGFDDLMAVCLRKQIDIRAHSFQGIWLDIGRPEDYASASELFHKHRGRLCPEVGMFSKACKLALV
jgi:mannose-1-phosphate guanylyltransferase